MSALSHFQKKLIMISVFIAIVMPLTATVYSQFIEFDRDDHVWSSIIILIVIFNFIIALFNSVYCLVTLLQRKWRAAAFSFGTVFICLCAYMVTLIIGPAPLFAT